MAKHFRNNKEYLIEARDQAIQNVIDMMVHLNDDFEGKLHFKTKIYDVEIEINIDVGPYK